MQAWLRRKDIDQVTVHEAGRRLVPTLGWPHLVALGIGAIVGTGIYTLIGVGADKAGPAVLLSFVIAGVVVLLTLSGLLGLHPWSAPARRWPMPSCPP
jgi:APA family basic amino acid/polyamine antiporter